MAGFPISAYLPRLLLARGPQAPRQWSVDGTLMFCDISGFTRLSDQLARRGREGGEDLVRTLVRIFTVLLSSSDDGGDVLKFGGDAMAILYTGNDHQRRACHAAYVMQRVIDVIGRVELTGARAKLRMSVGIHSGTIHLLLAGDSQQDLLVLGRDVTRTLELEGLADAGEILVSPQTATHLRPAEVGATKGPGVLVRRLGSQHSTGSQILFNAPRDEELWRYLPAPFQHEAERLTGSSDHRRAGIAFVAVTGLDAAVETDPDDVQVRLDALAGIVQGAAAEAGVSVLDTDVGKDGFKYLLAAGAPSAVEDPEGRIIRALLPVVAADVGLAVQAGCTSGRVFAGTVGAPFRSSYTAMGDMTNLAARLCAKASAGELLAHEPMLRRSLTEFRHGATRHLVLKGKPDPEPAVPVEGVVGQRGRTIHQVEFVGREKELEAIGQAFRSLERGAGAVVQVLGEPGLGKSRLANVALGRLGHELWWFTADPYGAQVPFATLRVVLRRLLDIPSDAGRGARAARLTDFVAGHCEELLPWLPLVAPVLGAELPETPEVAALDEKFRAERMREVLGQLLAALLPGPAAIAFDDAHWVDQASAEILEHALGDLSGRPWAVLLTRRDVTTGLRGSERLSAVEILLQPMDATTSQELLARHDRILRPDEVDAIVERAGGNPYFLLQLAEGGTEALPDTVEELVGARIDALEPLDRDILRNAAVIGSRFSPELYEAATADPGLRQAVAGAELGQYLALQGGEVVFTREVYREVAYTQLTFRGRRQLHRQTAEAIEASPALAGTARLPMLSLHYEAAGLWEKAFRASAQAGEAAAAAYANDEAIGFFGRALAAGHRIQADREELNRLSEALADACQTAGRFGEAARAYRSALRTRQDPVGRIQMLIKAGRVLDQSGDSSQARRMYARARRTVRRSDLPAVLLAELDLAEAASEFLLGHHGRARELAEDAWDLAAVLPEEPRVLRARARAAFVHDSAAGWADGAEGTRFGDLPLRIYEQLGDHYYAGITCTNLGVTAFSQGRWDDAAAYWSRGRDLSTRAGDRVNVAFTTMNMAETLGLRGHLAEAAVELERAIRSFRALGGAVGAIAAQTMLAAVALRRGDLKGCRDGLALARAQAVAIDDDHDVDEADALELDLLLAEGRPREVVERSDGLLERDLEPISRTRALRALGLAHEQLGDVEAARSALARALEVAVASAAAYEGALVQSELARLGGPDAEVYRQAAVETFERLGVPVSGVPVV